ncbi:amidase domain-containing protein [Paenibacillus sp. NPDC057886]|uniref:amidase domain-containing protein n=1 Tax=Paenibacillus sp. NPDC057886 TaxID=3346270 RepID=UPI003695B80A
MRVRYFIGWIVLFLITSSLLLVAPRSYATAQDTANKEKQEVEAFLDNLFLLRSFHLAKTDIHMDNDYDLASRSGRNALNIQKNRATYLNAWAAQRNMTVVDSQSKVLIGKMQFTGNQVKLTLGHSQRIAYTYHDAPSQKHWFGLGTWHVMTLTKNDGRWIVTKEWFLDPLEENPGKIPTSILPPPPASRGVPFGKHYNRQRAVAYANKYAGLAWGAGNKGKYNRKYKNYNHLGGDCTNFASQALGDPAEGGALRMQGPWRYYYPNGGTRTWVQTDAFKHFLLYSGYGTLLAKGYFEDLVQRTDKHPYGAIGELDSGDLIAHVMHNDVDHFSIVTGFDDHGYPLVNSHTADRYMAPFDLGWDNKTQYLFIHIRD